LDKPVRRKLLLSKSFEKAFHKFSKNHPQRKSSIEQTLLLMEQDVFSYQLRTHKLSGNLFSLLACSCGYDCRIVFSIEKENDKEVILLIDIGTHDDVY
jgi:addiction module RelE/StbE family toxin